MLSGTLLTKKIGITSLSANKHGVFDGDNIKTPKYKNYTKEKGRK